MGNGEGGRCLNDCANELALLLSVRYDHGGPARLHTTSVRPYPANDVR